MPVRTIDSTVKVYTRQASSEAWALNEKLTCLNVTDGYGMMQQHTARLKAITPGMANYSAVPAEQTAIDDAEKAMRYNADVEFQITNETAFYDSITGLWCKVTKNDYPLFIGQIFGSALDLTNQFCNGITAFGIDVLLSHQGMIGSLCYDSQLTVENFDSVPPYFNPQGRPNMGAVIDGANAFDYSLYAEFDDEANYWTPSTIVTYILYQLNNQVIDYETTPTLPDVPEKRYAYFSPVTNTQLALVGPLASWKTDEQKSSDLLIGADSVWATLVQLVEVNGPYTLGINYTQDGGTDYTEIEILRSI